MNGLPNYKFILCVLDNTQSPLLLLSGVRNASQKSSVMTHSGEGDC